MDKVLGIHFYIKEIEKKKYLRTGELSEGLQKEKKILESFE